MHRLAGNTVPTPPSPSPQEKLSSGVSYVIPTESRQKGVETLAPLPHLTIRPPGLKEVAGPAVEAMLSTIQGQVGGGPRVHQCCFRLTSWLVNR